MAALGFVRGPNRRKQRHVVPVEPLEGRTLLTASILIDPTNALSYTGSAVNNNLTISVSNGTYTFNETAETISVTNNGSAVVNGGGTNTVTVSGIVSIAVDTANGDDTVNLRSTAVPTTINTGAGGGDVVNLGSLAPATGGDLTGINGGVTIDDTDTSTLNMDDSGDATGRTVLIGQAGGRTVLSILGLSPFEFLVGEGVSTLNFNGGNGDDTFDAGGVFGSTTLNINGGGGNDTLAFLVNPPNLGMFDGGTGTNTIDYSEATVSSLLGVTVNLTTGTATHTSGIANVQNVVGSSGNDTIIGNNQGNIIHGGPGDDMIEAVGSTGTTGNSIFGDDGDDTIICDPGNGPDTIDGGTGNNTVIFNRGSGNNTMSVRTSSSDPTHTLFDDTAGFTADMVNVQQLNVQGQGSIDTLTVDFNNGSPFTNLTGIAGGPGVNYTGGGLAESLILERSGGTYKASSEVYDASGPSAGTISLDRGDIAFTKLALVDDTVPATSFTFNAPANDIEVDVFNGPIVGTFQTTELVSPTSAWALIDFANKTNVTLNSGNPAQTILLDNPKGASGLANLTINTGASPDQVTLTATPPGVAITIFTFAGNDSASVTGAGIPAGTTSTINAGVGFDTLQYDGGSAVVTITPGPGGGQNTIARAGSGSLVFQNFEQVTIVSAIAAAPVTGAPVAFAAVAGLNLVDVVVATFTSGGTGTRAADFGATIAWGDGTRSAGVVVQDASNPTVFYVQGSHLYTSGGTLTTTTTLRTLGGTSNMFLSAVPVTTSFGPSAPATVSGTATVTAAATVVGLTATFPTVSATERVPLNNVVIATIATAGGPPIDPRLYTATIDWGDATAPTPGFIDPTTGEVRGSHFYQESGTYTVRITVGTFDNPGLAVFTRTIDVADVPIVLTGRLDPASDSGISDSDGITNVRQPTFFGTSEAVSRVTLSAQNVLGGPAVSLGGTTADQSGFWRITSGVALVDGRYTIMAMAVDRSGVTTATTTLGAINIDTVGPRVTNLGFMQSPGRLIIQFRDDRSGLAQAPLTDGRNYQVEKPHLRPGQLLVGDLSVTPPTGPTNPQTVTAQLTNNARTDLRGGTFTVTVFNSGLGITDVAGNPLDGEFHGRFPSGNGVPGGNFVAIVDALHNRILAIGPSQQGTPIRNNPGAIPGVVRPPARSAIASAAPKKRQEAQKAGADVATAAAGARAAAQPAAAAQARAIAQENAAKRQAN
jgi:hypothetical protein